MKTAQQIKEKWEKEVEFRKHQEQQRVSEQKSWMTEKAYKKPMQFFRMGRNAFRISRRPMGCATFYKALEELSKDFTIYYKRSKKAVSVCYNTYGFSEINMCGYLCLIPINSN